MWNKDKLIDSVTILLTIMTICFCFMIDKHSRRKYTYQKNVESVSAERIDTELPIGSDIWCDVVLRPTGELLARGNPNWRCKEFTRGTDIVSYEFFIEDQIVIVAFDLEGRVFDIMWVVTDLRGKS